MHPENWGAPKDFPIGASRSALSRLDLQDLTGAHDRDHSDFIASARMIVPLSSAAIKQL